MAMNEYLAQLYGTEGTEKVAEEETVKLANAELFAKLAADNGVDLSQMQPEQIGELYASVFPEEAAKLAEESEKKEDAKDESEEKKEEAKEDEKKASAELYFQEKRAFQEKFAEADLMGRVMAHSFMQELGEIKEAGVTKQAAGWGSIAGIVDPKKLSLQELAARVAKVQPQHSEGAIRKVLGAVGKLTGAGHLKAAITDKAHRKSLLREGAKRMGATTGAVGAAGAAAAGIHHATKKKESAAQNFDELSAEYAIKMASTAGYDQEEAVERISAIHTLGMEESEKVAAAQDVETAMHVRALEYLEAAKYPVDWSQIYGEQQG